MRGKLSKSALLCLLCCLTGAFAAELDVDRLTLKGYTTKEVPFYTIYEPIEFVLEMDFGGQELEGNYTLDWSCSGDDGVTQKGQSAATEPVHIQTVLDRPGFVHVHALLRDPDGKAVVNAKGVGEAGKVTFDGGAGVDVEQIHGIPEPPDFDGFWKRQLAKLDEVPLAVNYMTEVPSPMEGVKVYAVSVACPGPAPVTGYLAIPEGAAEHSLLAIVRFQGYSTNLQQVSRWLSKSAVIFEINAHGYDLLKAHDPETGKQYHQDYVAALKSNGYSYAFDPAQNQNPETAYFNGMALRVLRALQFVKSLPEWDGKTLEARGGSQGGLQTIWAAALDHDVTSAFPEVPWCCNLAGKSCGRMAPSWGIPYVKELNYYDPIHLAKRIPKSCSVNVVRAGLGDYTCPPSGIAAFYNNLECPKEIKWVQGSTHGFVPTYDCQRVTFSAP
ncbi:MAG: acetylxylan esterase [Victivallales bacterium]|nr:acetylxylan esterase [Victivallales bacterium]